LKVLARESKDAASDVADAAEVLLGDRVVAVDHRSMSAASMCA
jgi:hypothetical protein